MQYLLEYNVNVVLAWTISLSMLKHNVLAQCPVSDLPTYVNAETDLTSIEGGSKVNVSCKYDHRAFHPITGSFDIVGNSTHNMWTVECDNSTNNFTWQGHPELADCKCIVSSALEQYSNDITSKNFTSSPLEGTDPISVGDAITFQCQEDGAEAGNTLSNQCKLWQNINCPSP